MEKRSKKFLNAAINAFFLGIVLLSNTAEAGKSNGIFLTCIYESREDGRTRSKINLKVAGLPAGKYFAQVKTPDMSLVKSRMVKVNARQPLEFEFDSNSEDVALGVKTAIPSNFTQSGFASGDIRKAKSNGQVKSISSQPCEIRNK